MQIIDTAKTILKTGYVCDNCLGRQFAQLLSGYTNKDRGKAIRLILAMQAELDDEKISAVNFSGLTFRNKKIKSEKATCCVCEGLFENLPKISKKILKEIHDLEYDTFHIGVRLSDSLLKNEESLWETSGIDTTESIKKELTREIGKLIQKKTKKEVDLKTPNIVILLNLDKNAIELTINSLYIYGRYKKYVKIPQTKHYCPYCHGNGCDKCNWRGLTYDTSVQQLIAEPILEATGGIDTKFHGQGREDIDVLCLGWRPFVIEVIEPAKRQLNLKKLKTTINKTCKDKIEIDSLRYSTKKELQNLKSIHPDKTYLLTLKPKKQIKEKDLEKLNALIGTITQQTPNRVKHRRADIQRKRKIYSVKYIKTKDNILKVELKTQAGLYIKELATGDDGRTEPSINALLATEIEVLDLTVLKVY
ncbi:MAG: tRNA pseudouridine(54/55) synthase Pus10 [Candidatus Nanohalarchaeota archaeon]|nr:MAG: tRNA pseudouridine(54/55) synthase Pus10 [Candidatus Nanohaloarchaeota archaeon]